MSSLDLQDVRRNWKIRGNVRVVLRVGLREQRSKGGLIRYLI